MRLAGLTFTCGWYPQIEGHPELDSPCWSITGKYLYFDADFNTRFPYGTSLCLRIGRGGPEKAPSGAPGFTLDVNAPLGEPNRLYLWLPWWRWVILSLPTRMTVELTDEEISGVPVYRVVRGKWHLSDKKLLSVHEWKEGDRGR